MSLRVDARSRVVPKIIAAFDVILPSEGLESNDSDGVFVDFDQLQKRLHH